MNRNIKKIMKLNELVTYSTLRKQTLVLDPEGRKDRVDLDNDIVYDKKQWKISEDYQKYIDELAKDTSLSVEEKILKIYEKISLDYVYDDNLISYMKKVGDDIFYVDDWYGRDTEPGWDKNREKHNRRVCYELARYLAKSLTELLKDNDDYAVCIHWDKEHTHYFVGLTCGDYSITLDPDDFNRIKDLTRIKAGLTAKGIVVLEDRENKFNNALRKFNKGKSENATKRIEYQINGEDILGHSSEEQQTFSKIDKNEDLLFLKKAIKILGQKDRFRFTRNIRVY